MTSSVPRDIIADRLAATGYVADRDLSTALWLMESLGRPLLLEGEAGVGKTEVAKALAAAHATNLIRLQCYEGLDRNAALYEWNYQRQLLAIKAREGADADVVEDLIFSEKYLLERPLLTEAASFADRRSRPRRRGIRSVPSRITLRFSNLDSRTRDNLRKFNPVRRADFQRHAGIVRCFAAAVSVSLCRLSGC
jgi:hypothetical protein